MLARHVPRARPGWAGLLRSRSAIAAVEFAIAAPLFVSLTVVGSDVLLAMRSRFRLEQASAQVAQIVTQYANLYDDDFTSTFFPIAQQLAGNLIASTTPLACGVTITGIGTTNAFPAIIWQKSFGTCVRSQVGTVPNPPTLPNGYTLPGDGTPLGRVPMIMVEINGQQSFTGPATAAVLGATTSYYQETLALPRQRVLPSITAGNRPS